MYSRQFTDAHFSTRYYTESLMAEVDLKLVTQTRCLAWLFSLSVWELHAPNSAFLSLAPGNHTGILCMLYNTTGER